MVGDKLTFFQSREEAAQLKSESIKWKWLTIFGTAVMILFSLFEHVIASWDGTNGGKTMKFWQNVKPE